jgi:hypothetical protein
MICSFLTAKQQKQSIVFGQLFNIFYTNTPDDIRTNAGIIAAVFVGIASL